MEKRKKSILIVAIFIIFIIAIIAIVFIVKGDKTKLTGTKEGIHTESEIEGGIKIEFTYYVDYWQKYDLTNAVYKTQAEYENAVRSYIDQIVTLLNKQNWYKQYNSMDTLYIALKISEIDDANSQGGIEVSQNNSKISYTCDLSLSNTMFKYNRSQLVHALTKLVLTKSVEAAGTANSSLEEGLCEYIQSKLGMGIGSYNYDLDIHNYFNELTKQYKENTDIYNNLNTFIDDAGNQSLNSTKYRFTLSNAPLYHKYWIICNYSFVDYLVNTYGLENVVKMVDGYDASIFYLFNQNGLSGLVSDWKQFLKTYPNTMSWEEIDAQITAIKSTHGY